jgi:hypothetical protein
MRQGPSWQCLWILPVVMLCLTLMGCAVRQPPKVKLEPIVASNRGLYTIDRIEKQIAIVLPRDQQGEPMAIPYDLVAFAQEGDIIYATGDPFHPYVPEHAETTRVQRDIDGLLARLQKRPDSVK